jgi:hypothetical protein
MWEALRAELRQGDRAVAEQLLTKMAELNEKLGNNMQALEDELFVELRRIAPLVESEVHARSKSSHAQGADCANEIDAGSSHLSRFGSHSGTSAPSGITPDTFHQLKEEVVASLSEARDGLAVELEEALREVHDAVQARLGQCSVKQVVDSARSELQSMIDTGFRDLRSDFEGKTDELVREINGLQEELKRGLGQAESANERVQAALDNAMCSVRMETQRHHDMQAALTKTVAQSTRELQQRVLVTEAAQRLRQERPGVVHERCSLTSGTEGAHQEEVDGSREASQSEVADEFNHSEEPHLQTCSRSDAAPRLDDAAKQQVEPDGGIVTESVIHARLTELEHHMQKLVASGSKASTLDSISHVETVALSERVRKVEAAGIAGHAFAAGWLPAQLDKRFAEVREGARDDAAQLVREELAETLQKAFGEIHVPLDIRLTECIRVVDVMSGQVGEALSRTVALERRLENAPNGSPFSLLESASTCEMTTSPATFSEARWQLAAIEDRLRTSTDGVTGILGCASSKDLGSDLDVVVATNGPGTSAVPASLEIGDVREQLGTLAHQIGEALECANCRATSIVSPPNQCVAIPGEPVWPHTPNEERNFELDIEELFMDKLTPLKDGFEERLEALRAHTSTEVANLTKQVELCLEKSLQGNPVHVDPETLHESNAERLIREKISSVEESFESMCTYTRTKIVAIDARLEKSERNAQMQLDTITLQEPGVEQMIVTKLAPFEEQLEALRIETNSEASDLKMQISKIKLAPFMTRMTKLEKRFEELSTETSTDVACLKEQLEANATIPRERGETLHESVVNQLTNETSDAHTNGLPEANVIKLVEQKLRPFEDRLEALRTDAAADVECVRKQIEAQDEKSRQGSALQGAAPTQARIDELIKERFARLVDEFGAGLEALRLQVRVRDEVLDNLQASSQSERTIVEERLSSLQEQLKKTDQSALYGTARLANQLDTVKINLQTFLHTDINALRVQLGTHETKLASTENDIFQIGERHDAHSGELASLRRSFASLTSDVLKAQGGADAAYAEATRRCDWECPLEAAIGSMREEWKIAVGTLRQEWQAETRDLAAKFQRTEGTCEPSTIRREAFEELRQNSRAWIQDAARVQEETVKAGIAQLHQQTNVVFEQCQSLNEATQQECRRCVDGALCRIEDLALKTRERFAAFASELRDMRGEEDATVASLQVRLDELSQGLESVRRNATSVDGRVGDISIQLEATVEKLEAYQRFEPASGEEPTGVLDSGMKVTAEQAATRDCCFKPASPGIPGGAATRTHRQIQSSKGGRSGMYNGVDNVAASRQSPSAIAATSQVHPSPFEPSSAWMPHAAPQVPSLAVTVCSTTATLGELHGGQVDEDDARTRRFSLCQQQQYEQPLQPQPKQRSTSPVERACSPSLQQQRLASVGPSPLRDDTVLESFSHEDKPSPQAAG